jgi:hypothetical protein
MTSRRNSIITLIVPGLALLTLAPCLVACTFGGPPPSAEDREARRDCDAEADRIFAARNRYQISERDQSDTPYAGNTLPSNPTAGLSDQYEQDRLVDTCLAHGGAGAPTGASATVPQAGPTAPTTPTAH